MRRCVMMVATALASLSLAGCLTTGIPAWEHFDACASQPTFHEMVRCAKARRQSACEANRNCSPGGDAVIAYAESLDQSVQIREMSEPEARRKWIEFRMARANELRQAAQAERAAGPVICTPMGNATVCN
jgi:hypothetical protein